MVSHITFGAQGWDACMSAVYRWRVREEEKSDEKGYFFQAGQFAALVSFTFKSTQENTIFVGKG